MSISLGKLAVEFACELRGDPDVEVKGVGTLQAADQSCVAFLANPAYRKLLPETNAAAVILDEAAADDCPVAALIHPNPYATYAAVAAVLHPTRLPEPGISASATIGPDCEVPASCSIGPGAVLESGVRLGERVAIGPNCVLQHDVEIGDDTRLLNTVTLYDHVRIGKRGLVHSGTVIGADGFGFAKEASGEWTKVPQVGSVWIGDDVEIGSNTSIDRGAIDDTIIGNGAKLDNLIQVAHNVMIGDHSAIAGHVGIAGTAKIGKRCVVAAQAGIAGHIEIADDVVILACTMVTHSIKKPGAYAGSVRLEEVSKWRRDTVRFGQLDDIARRLKALEKSVLNSGSDDDS